ncbi:MAG: glycosyltransferase family 4 protein [Actinobacteria bacterium]|nr:glycosyltransferase family 4 protein [Actinomycetota bacterium]
MAPHLLVTNDFPPKVGGIQSYLWELWRRLPAGETTVLTTPYPGSAEFDAAQPFRIERTRQKVLLPTPALAGRIRDLADEVAAQVIVVDPALPLGALGPRLGRPYVVVLHGSELLGRLPLAAKLMGQVVKGATAVVAAGNYPAAEAQRMTGGLLPPVAVIPPGVDCRRFVPLPAAAKNAARASFGFQEQDLLVVGVSRLVPRKGFDVLIRAAAEVAAGYPHLVVAIGGEGRDRPRLERLIARTRAPVRLLGRVDPDRLPALYGCADLFAMCCRTRWAGLEPEGFGIVFLEAAASGVAQLAGRSGGAADAVADGESGRVIHRPRDQRAVTSALGRLLADPQERHRMGERGRQRAESEFDYDRLAERLGAALEQAATAHRSRRG